MFVDPPEPLTEWRHFKGGTYTVITHAVLEKDLTPCVVYQGEDGVMWIRSVDEWNSTVVHEGKKVPRFQRL